MLRNWLTESARKYKMINLVGIVLFLPISRPEALSDNASESLRPSFVYSAIETLSPQAVELFSSCGPLPLEYSIYAGHSALRKVPSRFAGSKTFIALQHLLQKETDVSHEVLLGVDWTNLDEAEYAATHRGQTNWTQEHAFSDEDDLVHSIIHRLEGDLEGEGGYVGWDNAKYWAAGGPKCFQSLGGHPVHEALCRLCRDLAPTLEHLLIAKKKRKHEIIAGGGKRRILWVERGCFDPISFIALCRHSEWTEELRSMQIAEILLLIRMELVKVGGESCADLLD